MFKHNLVQKFSRITALVLIICMMFSMVFGTSAYGYTNTELRQSNIIEQVTSGSPDDDDYVSITNSGSSIDVTMKHSQKFDRIVLRLMKDGAIYKSKYFPISSDGTFQESFDLSTIPNGDYFFRIVVQKNKNADSGLTNYPTYLQGIDISVWFGTATMYSYDNIKASNVEKYDFSPSGRFTTKSLVDLKRQLFAKRGTFSTFRTFDASKEASFYKSVSDKVIAKAGVAKGSQYDKMKALFAYVADSFYYDNYTKATKRVPYDDPYYNLLYLVNKSGNGYNAFSGKVAIHCDAYAGILIALGRAQGIPCRLIYGRKVMPARTTNWKGCPDSYFDSSSHTWMQAWIDGRWVNIDPQQGSLNFYGSASDASDKTWKKSAIVNYTYFDISDTLMSYSHYALTMVSGNKTATYMNVSNEISQLRTFLSYSGNGKKLNKNYDPTRKSTWGTYKHFETNGYGSLKYISIYNQQLKGTLNVSNFDTLKRVSAYNNSLTRINTAGAKNLRWVYLSKNKLTSVDLSSQEELASGNFTNNPLVSAKFYADSILRTITATDHGTFGFKYYTSKTYPLEVYPKSDIGYKFKGLYNLDTGKLVSNKSSGCKLIPSGTSYSVDFALNPNSYKYTLKKGKNTATVKPYTIAAQKRLKELGYFKGTANGSFGPATMAAVKAFQSKNGMKKYGYIGKTTWKLLFSTNAKSIDEPEKTDPVTEPIPDPVAEATSLAIQ